jgi:cytochrome c oxidase subunit 4
MNEHNTHEDKNHSHGYGHYILIWFALLMLTGLTIAVAGINFGNLTIITALSIALVKSFLILKVFMHLEVEKRLFTIFVYTALFFLTVSLILLFADYSFLQG